MGIAVTIVIIYFVIGIILGVLMGKAAKEKGYDKSLSDGSYTRSYAWVITFFFGIAGCIYVAALPDLIQREQNNQVIELLRAWANATMLSSGRDAELPEL